jgi:hypothetical protein
MKPIKPIYIQRSNKPERIAGLVVLLIIASVFLLAQVASAQTIESRNPITKAGSNKEKVQGAEGTLITWNINADVKYPFFLVERTTDNVHYELVSVIKNTGNINCNTFFSTTDYNPLAINTVYRISELDSKGKPTHLFKVTVPSETTQLSQR